MAPGRRGAASKSLSGTRPDRSMTLEKRPLHPLSDLQDRVPRRRLDARDAVRQGPLRSMPDGVRRPRESGRGRIRGLAALRTTRLRPMRRRDLSPAATRAAKRLARRGTAAAGLPRSGDPTRFESSDRIESKAMARIVRAGQRRADRKYERPRNDPSAIEPANPMRRRPRRRGRDRPGPRRPDRHAGARRTDDAHPSYDARPRPRPHSLSRDRARHDLLGIRTLPAEPGPDLETEPEANGPMTRSRFGDF